MDGSVEGDNVKFSSAKTQIHPKIHKYGQKGKITTQKEKTVKESDL